MEDTMEKHWWSNLLSGRFWLTVMCGLTFVTMSVQQKIDKDDSMLIIGIVITHYFTKDRPEEK